MAQLNGQIKLAEQAGQPPNDMLDRRDLLLDKLSSLAQVTVTQARTGPTRSPSATRPNRWSKARRSTGRRRSRGGRRPARRAARADGEGGSARGFRARTGHRRGDDRLERQRLHTARRSSPGTTAATIAVAVKASEVQSSSTGAVGGNDIALAIAGLRGGAADQGYSALSSGRQRGQDGADEQANMQATVTAIGNQRQSVSGVSLDEEMTNLISFQRGYQASARTLTAMDEMLES
jgi:flagellar hook-associated protein 1 FlgK